MQWPDRVRLGWSILHDDGWPGVRNAAWTLWALWREPERVLSEPTFVQIEPTVVCNLRCTMCNSPYIKREVKTLSLEKFRQMLDQLPRLRKISLVGIGEPTLNRELFDMVRLARRRHINVGFTTNATLLTTKTIAAIVETAPDWVEVSIDGATKETFERIRVGANFEQVLANVRALTAAVGSRRCPRITAWFVIMRENIQEFPDVVDLVAGLGVRNLAVQSLQSWGHEEWTGRLQSQTLHEESALLARQFREARRRAKRQRIALQHVNIPDPKGRRLCNRPWKAAYLTTDGFVTPCCLQGSDPTVINFGNVFEQSFREIWNSDRYQAFRRQLKSEQPPKVCEGCPAYHVVADL